jgi:hypothetical protein
MEIFDMNDWLGNELNVGDLVVYTSKSSHVGMVLGKLKEVSSSRIQIIPIKYSEHDNPSKIITLHPGQTAFKAVTRYFGSI